MIDRFVCVYALSMAALLTLPLLCPFSLCLSPFLYLCHSLSFLPLPSLPPPPPPLVFTSGGWQVFLEQMDDIWSPWRQLCGQFSQLWYYILIVTLESDTRKYHEFIAAYCYECEAHVTMPEAMNEWCFHGITLYSEDKEFIVCKPERLLAESTLSNERFP